MRNFLICVLAVALGACVGQTEPPNYCIVPGDTIGVGRAIDPATGLIARCDWLIATGMQCGLRAPYQPLGTKDCQVGKPYQSPGS